MSILPTFEQFGLSRAQTVDYSYAAKSISDYNKSNDGDLGELVIDIAFHLGYNRISDTKSSQIKDHLINSMDDNYMIPVNGGLIKEIEIILSN